MVTLFEVVAMVTLGGFGIAFFRRRLRRGSALALVLACVCGVATLSTSPAAAATEFVKGVESAEISENQTIKGDLFVFSHHARVDGKVEGDVYLFCQDASVNGTVDGDVIAFSQALRVSGKVNGNIRGFVNNLTLTGTVNRNVLLFAEVLNVDANGKIDGSLTAFLESLHLDGPLGRDLLFFGANANIASAVGGSIRARGDNLSIRSSAQVAGPIHFDGNHPPEVSPQAKLASPVDYQHIEHKSRYREGHYYVWRVIWTAAFILLGMVLVLLTPNFGRETVAAAERCGAPIGLGVLVFFGVPIAAIIACVTVVGIPLGLLTFVFWLLILNCAELVVGAVVGNWILGKARDTWELIGRMTVGFILVRAVYTPIEQVHVLGFLVGLGIWIWGMGAIALALYRRIQPAIAPSTPSAPFAPPPLPPNTTFGGAQPA
jgi:cytoskeletal protein CcmA (bactofilin family)